MGVADDAEVLPVNDAINDYAQRLSGFFIPPTSGAYVFFLSSDDDSDLWLSTDETPAKKRLIAQENAWSNTREWTNSSGGSVVGQKRSDQWANTSGETPYSAGIDLTAGSKRRTSKSSPIRAAAAITWVSLPR